MKYISIKGLNKPVSALMKGTDYFYHDSYEKRREYGCIPGYRRQFR